MGVRKILRPHAVLACSILLKVEAQRWKSCRNNKRLPILWESRGDGMVLFYYDAAESMWSQPISLPGNMGHSTMPFPAVR